MQALQMFVDADLTQGQYEIIRKTNKKFFPCYSALQKAKKKCYPPQESCTITSTSAETQLQPLMDVTIRFLSEYLEEVLITLKEQERESLTIISKWGCDGSQQSQFNKNIKVIPIPMQTFFKAASCLFNYFVEIIMIKFCGKIQRPLHRDFVDL